MPRVSPARASHPRLGRRRRRGGTGAGRDGEFVGSVAAQADIDGAEVADDELAALVAVGGDEELFGRALHGPSDEGDADGLGSAPCGDEQLDDLARDADAVILAAATMPARCWPRQAVERACS